MFETSTPKTDRLFGGEIAPSLLLPFPAGNTPCVRLSREACLNLLGLLFGEVCCIFHLAFGFGKMMFESPEGLNSFVLYRSIGTLAFWRQLVSVTIGSKFTHDLSAVSDDMFRVAPMFVSTPT